MAIPDVHTIDHPIILIHEADKAWDHDRIRYEQAVLTGKLEAEAGRPVTVPTWDDHPWRRYVYGLTRGHLSAEVEAYLQGEPTKFYFRRAPWSVWVTVKELGGMSSYTARAYVARCTLTKIEGPGAFEFEGGKNGEPLTERDQQQLWDAFGDELMDTLGFWAYRASQRLTESEKKP